MSIEKVKTASEALLTDFEDVQRLKQSGRSGESTEAAVAQADADAVQLARVLQREADSGAIDDQAAATVMEKVGRLRDLDDDMSGPASEEEARAALRDDIEQATRTLSEGLEESDRR
jgi:hypothetical protein